MATKKEVYKVKPLNENKKNIIAALINEYDIQTADDIQAALHSRVQLEAVIVNRGALLTSSRHTDIMMTKGDAV